MNQLWILGELKIEHKLEPELQKETGEYLPVLTCVVGGLKAMLD